MANLSNFPDWVDTFKVMSDIQADDIDYKSELEILMKMNAEQRTAYGNWQQRVGELRVLLNGKIIASEDITKIQDAIINVQAYLLHLEQQVNGVDGLAEFVNELDERVTEIENTLSDNGNGGE